MTYIYIDLIFYYIMSRNCPKCGAEIKTLTQNFCETCGSELPSSSEKQIQTQPEIVQTKILNLFDINQNYFILKDDDYWKTGSGYIYNAYDQIIGIVDGRRKNRIDLQEADGTIVATIQFKGSMKGASALNDQDGNIIAKLKKKKITTFDSIYFLEDPSGTRWYEATGEFISFQFQIVDLSINKVVAECDKTKKWKNILPGKFNDDNDYSLTILDNETDRRILLLFLIGVRQIRAYRRF